MGGGGGLTGGGMEWGRNRPARDMKGWPRPKKQLGGGCGGGRRRLGERGGEKSGSGTPLREVKSS